MKAILIVIFSLLIKTAIAHDECYRLVTQNYTRDSIAYSLEEFDILSKDEPGSPQYARAAIMELEAQLGCDAESELIDRIYISKCKRINNGEEFSRICFVKTAYGYYFVSVDLLGKINIVFSRFD
ncbi:MAG: hypothetical protein CME71_01920 [Halobacteriovorax sp.]|nr:hypothetical protein [Halobacteriovorax sp.]|tara:strand:- start:1515 stop:1889 length:375 start_codon:yes stop_codon:yes gene_type:complete